MGNDADKKFWNQKWENNQIGFHKNEVNPLLIKHFPKKDILKGSRIFLPLCGKTLDIGWFLLNDYQVVGVELVEKAVEQLFFELKINPTVLQLGEVKHYKGKGIDLFVGDIFSVTEEMLGEISYVYDRAALVALPEVERNHYASHVIKITKKAPQLIVTFEYDQAKFQGPPFAISTDEMNRNYGVSNYKIHVAEEIQLASGMRGFCPAKEVVWLLN